MAELRKSRNEPGLIFKSLRITKFQRKNMLSLTSDATNYVFWCCCLLGVNQCVGFVFVCLAYLRVVVFICLSLELNSDLYSKAQKKTMSIKGETNEKESRRNILEKVCDLASSKLMVVFAALRYRFMMTKVVNLEIPIHVH